MDFVDLDKVLDEFEEEEKQALSIVPGQELRPSGYLEFLEKHQEQEWALINPPKFSSTSGYTLERRSAREPANVSYDDPYDSFSTHKLRFLTENQLDSLSQNGYERLPEGNSRRSKSAIVTSLTRLSLNDNYVNTVYTTTAKGYERKGIANYSERKGTVAYQAAEVQTDALSPASERELMSLPFPKSDIIVDGHKDAAVSSEPIVSRLKDQTHFPIYEGIVSVDMINGGNEMQQSLGSNTGYENETQQTTSRIVDDMNIVHNATAQFNITDNSCETGTGFPFSERMDTIANSVVQYSMHSFVVNNSETNTLTEQAIGFHDPCDETLDDKEIAMYLHEFSEQKMNTSEMLGNANSLTLKSQDAEAQILNLQSCMNHFKNNQSQSVADEVTVTEVKADNFTSHMESPKRHYSNVVPMGSDVFHHNNQDIASDLRHYSQHVNETQLSEKFGHWNNVPYVEPSQRNTSHVVPCNRNISYIEPSCRNINSVVPSGRNMPYVVISDRNVPSVVPTESSTSLDHSDRQDLYNSLISEKMEIEAILDDVEKKLSENLEKHIHLHDAGTKGSVSSSINEHLLQERTEIEDILDEVILKQQRMLEDGFPPRLLSESSDLFNSSYSQPDVNGSDTTGAASHVTLPQVSDSEPACSGHSSLDPVLSVVARPKDPSAVTKNRPNSLHGLSKISLGLPLVKKPKVIADMEDASFKKHSVTTDVQFSDTALQSQQFSSSRLTNSFILDSQTVTEARLRSDSASIFESEAMLHQPFIDSQNGQENEQSLVKTDGLDATDSQRMKGPSSLDLLMEAKDRMEQTSEEGITFEDSSAIPSSATLPESERTVEETAVIQNCTGGVDTSMTLQTTVTQDDLGDVAPFWIPDSEALSCMVCLSKFTIWKRRHHCRACGKVLCAMCCSRKAVLRYLENKEARVCIECHRQLNLEQTCPSQDPTKISSMGQQQQPSSQTIVLKEDSLARCHSLIPEGGLPPLCVLQNETGSVETFSTLKWSNYMTDYKSEDGPLVMYAVNRNLSVGVKILNLDCCMNKVCWCLVTRGMDTAGQSELVILLELTEEELANPSLSPPRDMFLHFQTIYEEALKGNIIQEMGYFIFRHMEHQEHDGFLFLQPTFQCLIKIPLPECPYLFGILIQKWEVPWARVFPMRLMLRLGAEYRYYPCPLLSIRNRKPVFFEIGHTIINLLADFRSYQYTLPQIRGLIIHMENKKTVISLPRNRYSDIMKAVHNSNEHVMAMGSWFSSQADSHLVCIQSEDGSYQTQAINIQGKPRLVTGASFVVFNGALKLNSGFHAKFSIVEDGLMVQVIPEVMASIKEALKNMKDYAIQCGLVETATSDEIVELKWVDSDKNFNIGLKSYIDGTSLEGLETFIVKSPCDYLGDSMAIRWTRVYFLQYQDSTSHHFDPTDISQLMEDIAHATCTALVRNLDELKKEGQTKLGLRVNLTRDSIDYEIGSQGRSLPVAMLNNLDAFLVPVVHQASEEGIILEFVFSIFQ